MSMYVSLERLHKTSEVAWRSKNILSAAWFPCGTL